MTFKVDEVVVVVSSVLDVLAEEGADESLAVPDVVPLVELVASVGGCVVSCARDIPGTATTHSRMKNHATDFILSRLIQSQTDRKRNRIADDTTQIWNTPQKTGRPVPKVTV